MQLGYRLLGPRDLHCLEGVADGVFDHAIDKALAREFLDDERHHIAVASDGGVIVGFASAVHYVHPDKPAQLWINEVGVAPAYQRRGIGKALMQFLLEEAKRLGCTEAWVLTESANEAANALYRSTGGTVSQLPQRMYTFAVAQR